MRRQWMVAAALALLVSGCEDDFVLGVTEPAPPRGLEAFHQGGVVVLNWELHPDWNGESFRVYGKRESDPDFFLIAEVTSCAGGLCTYTDLNVEAGISYRYFVSAVTADGLEAESAEVSVFVPAFAPPPVPGGVSVIALDATTYLRWDANARSDEGFSHYRVYLVDGSDDFFLGETDSEGFLDQLVANGTTYTYYVTAVNADGQESGRSGTASGTPRPDFHGELVHAYEDRPETSGFRFQDSEATDPVVDGDAASRHFRLESDGFGWWIVPGPDAEIQADGVFTTMLKCGVAADVGCVDLSVAPSSGYTTAAVAVSPELTYALRVVGNDGQIHYGAVRVALLGFDQSDAALMIFDWAYQLDPGNRQLIPGR